MADDQWNLKPHPTISTPSREHPLLVCVLDGWGEAPDAEDNAISLVRAMSDNCHMANHPPQPSVHRSWTAGCSLASFQHGCATHVHASQAGNGDFFPPVLHDHAAPGMP